MVSEPHFVLYSKLGCHLCEGLEEKLRQIPAVAASLEIRDIASREAWLARYRLEIPVLCWVEGDRETELPRFSPRATVAQIQVRLRRYVRDSD